MTKLYDLRSGNLVTENDFFDLSEEFLIPTDVIAEVFAQIEVNNERRWDREAYSPKINARLDDLMQTLVDRNPVVIQREEDEDAVAGTEAAGFMLTTMTEPMDDHYIIQPDGSIEINKESPPTIEKTYEVGKKIVKCQELAEHVRESSSWYLGAFIVAAKEYHGDTVFDIGQIVELTNKKYNTVITCESVYRRYGHCKIPGLNFTIHKEVHTAAIPDEQKKVVFRLLRKHKGTAAMARQMCNWIKATGESETLEALSPSEMRKRMAALAKQRVQYLVCKDNSWKRIRGTAMEIPEGEIVIDLRNMTVRTNGSDPSCIPLASTSRGSASSRRSSKQS